MLEIINTELVNTLCCYKPNKVINVKPSKYVNHNILYTKPVIIKGKLSNSATSKSIKYLV